MKKVEPEVSVLLAKYVRLTKDEQRRLSEMWKVHGDVNARNTLAASVDLYILGVARKFAKGNLKLIADFFQEGRMGAIRAVDKFDPKKGYKFLTYASWWIRVYIQVYIRSQGQTMPFEISSLDELTGEKMNTTKLDKIDDPSKHPEEQLGLNGFGDREMVRQAIKLFLNKTERFVVWMRFFNPTQPTLSDVGRNLGVSRERIRQIEASAIRKLKAAMENWDESLKCATGDLGIGPNEVRRAVQESRIRPPLLLVKGHKK